MTLCIVREVDSEQDIAIPIDNVEAAVAIDPVQPGKGTAIYLYGRDCPIITAAHPQDVARAFARNRFNLNAVWLSEYMTPEHNQGRLPFT